jgi:hypothetical protein
MSRWTSRSGREFGRGLENDQALPSKGAIPTDCFTKDKGPE